MSVAVVFDSAGTLLYTYRVVKDVVSGKLEKGVETTELAFSCESRILVILYARSLEIIAAPPDKLLSEFLGEHKVGFGVACACQVVTSDEVSRLLYQDTAARVGDLQDCIRTVWEVCKKETIVAMNSGVMLNQTTKGIEYVITSGGRPFVGAKETVAALQRMGIATYIASGDRTEKLVRMADYLGIPHDNVHGVATPAIKAQVIEDLKRQYDLVVMVGDGINDLDAMRRADVAILSEQQSPHKPPQLYRAADHVIRSVTEVADILCTLVKAEEEGMFQYKK
jgi:soluble P-type ATPase